MRYILILLLFVSIRCFSQFRVVQVYDADSFACIEETTGQRLEVRLSAIDAPERSMPNYQDGKDYLTALILNKRINLVIVSYDQYLRVVADCYINDTWINKELVLKGFCFVYPKYCKDPELYKCESIAKYHSLGVWRHTNQTRPWTFRKEKHHKA